MQNKVKVKNKQMEQEIKICQGQNLLHVLQENKFPVSHVCYGNGTCGKCKVKIISEHIPVSEADQRMLPKEELEQGIRLACKVEMEKLYKIIEKEALSIEIITPMEEDIVIEGLMSTENGNTIVNKNGLWKRPEKGNSRAEVDFKKEDAEKNEAVEEEVFIAIDIGTTTLAMALVNAETGEICDTYTSLNHQKKFGADVISRITASNAGKAEELKQLIEEDLWQGICKLIQTKKEFLKKIYSKTDDGEVSCGAQISRIIISGNTTMIHLLMGYSCQILGKYPFTSKHLAKIECTLEELIRTIDFNSTVKILGATPVTIFPGISAFVGGDLVAGILACPAFETEQISLLIDLGTNGEMVLGNRRKIVAASTAAGPAFEGGNIICGTASIPGSISRIKIQNQKAIIKTINNKVTPVGICGTGLVSVISQLKQNHVMEKSGRLKFPYCEKGYPLWVFENGEKIALYQQDIREFQMAKSAIRAGIEILMEEYGCVAKEISHVYLAGGFGVHLSVEDAVMTGILPEEFREKTEAIGNGALKGAIQYGLKRLRNENEEETESSIPGYKIQIDRKVENILRRTESLSLAENKRFQEIYLKYLEF